ncbi:hypothetical protein GCM10007108_12120 [Thermogymnomonas acidicola]|uniref:VWFA domain-containing protein n=1 Tax=Thermogymnomonas acidicola TaxID=399579 RepID=A0AA37FB93_9ARCH|nr:vWA domain-containing protein [Thermogymnomonas acidicola]GGM75771.1 hypothetical protein GCM10007108_12120 [Thermogymnomonas acidicola]
MSYTAEISRRNPGLFIFLLDQSRSMSHRIAGGKRSKAEEATDAINRQIYELVNRCTKSDGIRDYFEVGIIGYGFRKGEAASLLVNRNLVPISEMDSLILRMETRKQVIDGEEVDFEFPIWFEPVAASDTPMVRALSLAEEWASAWASEHQSSFPPVIINISDGDSTDGDPVPVAERIMGISTDDGNAMIWNCHLSETKTDPVSFPSDPGQLPPDKYARQMFSMSSLIPESMVAIAREEYRDVSEGARAYVFNAQLEDLIKLLDIGTRAITNQMR